MQDASTSSDGDTAVRRLHELVGQRELLRPRFQSTWQQLSKRDPDALKSWAVAATRLIEVNAGAACQIAFWSASAAASDVSLRALATAGLAAAEICRQAGAQAALACLQTLTDTMQTTSADGMRAWWRGLERLAREADDCVPLAAAHAQTLLADRHGRRFTDFVAAGLKAYAHDPVRRRCFFSLEESWAQALLTTRADLPGFDTLSDMLTAFSIALWSDPPSLRAAMLSDNPEPRASKAGGIVLLPAALGARSGPHTEADARALYLAMVAHACAHSTLPPVRHTVGALKPMQTTLITLIEDARIEALAMRALPGLRNLWGPFHRVAASGARTAPNLMARLSRGLFDPLHPDNDGFVVKARRMFAEEAANGLDDPLLSLRIGRVLGHDLGQMRVQFNWRDYVIEPAYRDDGSHLWEPPDDADTAMELMVQAARSRGETAGHGRGDSSPAGRAREAAADERGVVVARYPEWDQSSGVERPDWTHLRDVPARAADPASLASAVEAEAVLRGRIIRLVRSTVIGRPVRLARQPDGDDLDMDAALDAIIAMRSGRAPDMRLFRSIRTRIRDMATLILLDSSASTAATLPDGRSVLEIQCLAVSLLGQALDASRDAFALRAFASDGREDVRLIRIKEFSERFDAFALSRLAGLRSGLSTRLGAALRHARSEFHSQRTSRRLLLVLTDGEPSDVDVSDSSELVVDARRAVIGLKQACIDVFGIVLDPLGAGSAAAIFGRSNIVTVQKLSDLPARLASLYFRLTRR